jgi:RNAse (barnase) inhibitor barstar
LAGAKVEQSVEAKGLNLDDLWDLITAELLAETKALAKVVRKVEKKVFLLVDW